MKQYFARQAGPYSSLLVLIVIMMVPHSARAVRNLKVGDSMPTFFLPRADKISGMYTYENMAGQPAVITFSRPNHKFSLEVLRDLEAVAQDIGTHRFKLIAVDTKLSTAQEVRASLADETISFPILLDPNRNLYEKVGLIVSPTTLLFDGKGKLRFVVTSHARQFRHVVHTHLRFLLGEIDEQTMNQQMTLGTAKIESGLVAAWRMYRLGVQLQAEGRTDEAASTFEKTIAEYPSLAEARCALGFLKLAAGEPNVAAGQFRAALSHKPGLLQAQLGLAIILARTGKESEAEPILLSLVSQRSLGARAQYELGRIYLARGERDKAITLFQDALAAIFPEPWSPAKKP